MWGKLLCKVGLHSEERIEGSEIGCSEPGCDWRDQDEDDDR